MFARIIACYVLWSHDILSPYLLFTTRPRNSYLRSEFISNNKLYYVQKNRITLLGLSRPQNRTFKYYEFKDEIYLNRRKKLNPNRKVGCYQYSRLIQNSEVRLFTIKY